jgi:hypothetical protein
MNRNNKLQDLAGQQEYKHTRFYVWRKRGTKKGTSGGWKEVNFNNLTKHEKKNPSLYDIENIEREYRIGTSVRHAHVLTMGISAFRHRMYR